MAGSPLLALQLLAQAAAEFHVTGCSGRTYAATWQRRPLRCLPFGGDVRLSPCESDPRTLLAFYIMYCLLPVCIEIPPFSNPHVITSLSGPVCTGSTSGHLSTEKNRFTWECHSCRGPFLPVETLALKRWLLSRLSLMVGAIPPSPLSPGEAVGGGGGAGLRHLSAAPGGEAFGGAAPELQRGKISALVFPPLPHPQHFGNGTYNSVSWHIHCVLEQFFGHGGFHSFCCPGLWPQILSEVTANASSSALGTS